MEVVQVLGPSELDPTLTGDMRLVDSETDITLDVSSAESLLSLYEEYRLAHESHVADLCRQRSGKFASVSSDHSLEWVLFDLLRRKGWVK